ncbi:hypothetical protein LPJ66_009194, partial [Kickxella alabastrina]
MAADFIAANAGVAIDTVVSMACLVSMFSAKPTRRKDKPAPLLIALGIINVALVTQSAFTSSVVLTASLSATVSLTAYSAFCHYLNTSCSSSNALACLHLARVYRLVQSPLLLSLPTTAASAAIHLCLAWYALDLQLKSNILFHLKGMCAIDGFVIVKISRGRDLVIDDLSNRSFEKKFSEDTKKAVFDPRQRFFIIRGLIMAEWKELATVLVADTLINVALHWRKLLFVGILAAISSPGPVDFPSLAVLLVIWQLLLFAHIASDYISTTRGLLKKKMHALLRIKSLEFFMASNCNINSTWTFDNRIEDIVFGISSLLGALGSAFGQFFNVWIIYREIGWHITIPVVITLTHQLSSHLVSQKIEHLRQLNRATRVPRFQDDYFNIIDNIRTIKCYAWEKVFMGAKSWYDLPEYVPPMAWNVASYSVDLIGCASSQISAALTIIIFFSTSSKPVSYAGVALLMGSIDSLTEFTKKIASVGKEIAKINKGVTFMQTLVDDEQKVFITHVPETSENGVAVELDNCVLSWGDNKFALDPITMCVKAGEFVTIIGRVGGGKSSLLSGLCGEMPVVGGHGRVYGRIGYVSQKPYIMNDTFRENVLMGAEYDEKWMHQVLEACALSEDVEQFAAGDLSEIGYKGINLSGGQKVRLALARALYLKADIYIFDDLLAAVDARVERLIVERVLASSGIIGGKARILVTHAEHLVPLSSKVITLAEGHAEIAEQQPVDFVSLVNTDEHISELSTENDSPRITDTKSSEFTIYPKLKDPPFKMWQLWSFTKLSGYEAVAIVVLIQLAKVYAIYYAESLRIDLMVDSNPDTMRQSMSRYLIVNALIEIGRMQVSSFESWIRKVLWIKPLSEQMRRQLVDLFLSLPLTVVEGLSRSQSIDILMNDQYRITRSLPYVLCNSVFNGFSAATSILQVVKTSPKVLLLCLPMLGASVLYQMIFSALDTVVWGLGIKHLYQHSGKFNSVILQNRTLLRIHRCADQYLDRFRVSIADRVYYDYLRSRLLGSNSIIRTICTELIRSGILLFNIRRRLYTGTPVLAGEVD